MERHTIPINDLTIRPHHLWDTRWLLLTAGDFSTTDFNTMTVAWGSFGTMWSRPFAQVVVRPTRHTYRFIESYPTFTLSAFPDDLRPALQLLGTRSGRDGDKIAASGLTPVAAETVAAPTFAEAELVVECRKIYAQDMDPAQFFDPAIEDKYPDRDYHRIYFGEIVTVCGIPRYST